MNSAVRAGDAAAYPSKIFLAILIRFGQNQNLHPQKHSLSYGYDDENPVSSYSWF